MADTGSHSTVSGSSTPLRRQPERIVDSPFEVEQAQAKARGTPPPGALLLALDSKDDAPVSCNASPPML